MYKGKKIAAIIPARKGSKGIPNKNMIHLMGIPLVEHTIIQSRKSQLIDKIIVSTDSKDIVEIIRKYKLDFRGLRPENLSNDTANLYDVIKYEIKNHQLIENEVDLIILLQPTSPLRKSYMIDQAIKIFIDEDQESAVSVSEVDEHPIFMRSISQNGELKNILKIESEIRRQDLPKYYIVNGMIYINKISDIMEKHVSMNDNKSPIIIPKEFAVDIDSMDDLKAAERKLKKVNETENCEQIKS